MELKIEPSFEGHILSVSRTMLSCGWEGPGPTQAFISPARKNSLNCSFSDTEEQMHNRCLCIYLLLFLFVGFFFYMLDIFIFSFFLVTEITKLLISLQFLFIYSFSYL